MPGLGGFTAPFAHAIRPARTAPSMSGSPGSIASRRCFCLRIRAAALCELGRRDRREAAVVDLRGVVVDRGDGEHAVVLDPRDLDALLEALASAFSAVFAPPVSWMSGVSFSRSTAATRSLWNGFQPDRWKCVKSSAS